MEGQQDVARPAPAPEHAARESARVRAAVRHAQAGDRDALGFLYARFAEDVCAYAASIVRDPHDAQDITQQVFAKLTGAIGKYEEREVPFLAWMLRVTRNVALDHMRRRRPIPVAEVRGVDAAQAAPLAGSTQLAEALATLPPAQREVLLMRHLVGLSPSEIAARTSRTESSVHGLHHRGRKALKAELLLRGASPATLPPREQTQGSSG